MKSVLSVFISLILLTSQGKAQLCISPEAENFYQRGMQEINTKHIVWLKSVVADIESGKSDPVALPDVAGNYRHQTNIGAMDVEGLMQIILMQVAKDSEKDLRDMLDEMKKQNEQKKKMRNAISRLKQQQKDMKEMLRSEYDSLRRLTLNEAPARITTNASAIIQPKKVTAAEIHTLLDNIRDKEDSMNELGEEMSLRIQQYMDRYSKYICMLSNLIKKNSETVDSIISNLK